MLTIEAACYVAAINHHRPILHVKWYSIKLPDNHLNHCSISTKKPRQRLADRCGAKNRKPGELIV